MDDLPTSLVATKANHRFGFGKGRIINITSRSYQRSFLCSISFNVLINVRQQLPCPLECHLSSFLHKFVDTSQLVEYVTSPSPHSSCIGRHALYIMLCGIPLSYSAINRAKQVLKRSLRTNSTAMDVPKGCLAIYIGETQK